MPSGMPQTEASPAISPRRLAMIEYGHFIGGKHGQGHERPHGRRVPADDRRGARQGGAGLQGRGGRGRRERQGRAAGLGRDQPAAPRPRDDEVPGARQPRLRQARRLLAREHGKTIADAKGDIQRGLEVVEFAMRHPAPHEGRVHRGRRARHRPLFHAPAARRRGRHHAVQLPGHDPAVEVRARRSPAATPSSSSRRSATPACR